jgi:hypothetical protein
MTNAERAAYYRSIAVLYDRLAALDMREARIAVLAREQSEVDAARKQVTIELDALTTLEVSSGAIPSGIPIPPSQPPV